MNPSQTQRADLSQRLRRLFAHDVGSQYFSNSRAALPHAIDEARQGHLDEWACGKTLFAFDFDGTLAPMVDDPERSRLPAPTARALTDLTRGFRVAVISGRARADLIERLPPDLSYIVGNHGNEGLPDDLVALPPREQHVCADWEGQLLAGDHEDPMPVGMVIENKGETLSLHYRGCDHPLLASIDLSRRAHALSPTPRVIPGVLVFNLLPPRAWTKREAFMALLAHSACTHGVFVGDDASDEQVFADAPSRWLTIGIGTTEGSAARYHMRAPDEVGVFMNVMVERRQHVLARTAGFIPLAPQA